VALAKIVENLKATFQTENERTTLELSAIKILLAEKITACFSEQFLVYLIKKIMTFATSSLCVLPRE